MTGKTRSILKIVLVSMGVLFSMAIPQTHSLSEAPAATATITYVDASQFPLITLHMIARDAKGIPISNLNSDGLQIEEDQATVPFHMEKKTYGTQLAYMADVGMGISASGATGQSRWLEMADALTYIFSSDWMLTGKDNASLAVQEPGSDSPNTLVGTTNDHAQLVSAVQQYELKPESNQYSDGLKGINATLEFLASAPNDDGQFRAIVFLSQGLQSGSPQDVTKTIANLRTAGIPVFTVLFRSEEVTNYAQPMRNIAAQTSGGYYFYTGRNSIRGLKDLLQGCRDQYVITYTSSAKESGNKVITLKLNRTDAPNPGVGKYSITISPPVISIVSPKAGEALTLPTPAPTPTQDASVTTTPGSIMTPSAVPGYHIEAGISWPDGHPRKIKLLELLVNGQTVLQENDPASLAIFITPDNLPKDLGSYGQLQVRATDELGLKAESKQVNVTFSAGSAGVGSLCSRLPGSLQGVFCGGTQPLTFVGTVLPCLSFLLAVAALVLVIIFRKPISGAASKAASRASDMVEEVGNTLRFRGRLPTAKAYLQDVERTSGLSRSVLELYGTTSIGRSRKNAELIVQPNVENSPISRLHCTIIEEDGDFFVRDDQSANGTYLNGTRLVPLDRKALKDGDEIELAKMERGGVKFRFQRTKPEEGRKPSADDESIEMTNRVAR
jgi:hypothetical protein